MKILIIHNILWTHYKSVLFEEIEKQKDDSMEIMVLQIARNELSRKNMEAPNKKYNYKYHLLFDNYIENISPFKKSWAVIKFIFRYKPDIINIGGWGADISITLGLIYSLLTFKKVIISNESTLIDQKRSFLKELFKKTVVKLSKGFIVFGKTSQDYLVHLGASEDKIIVKKGAVVDDYSIRNAADKFRKIPLPEVSTTFNFLFVGRMIEVKNLPLLIEAFQNLKKEGFKDWGLILVGNGQEELHIKQLAQKLPGDIYFFDSVDWLTVPKYYSQADCLILPSFSETWGLVVNEAMICGLSVIVSDQCGCGPDLVKNNGYIFKSGDLKDLENKMKNMAIDTKKLELMKNNSLKIIEEFKLKNVAEKIIVGFRKIGNSK